MIFAKEISHIRVRREDLARSMLLYANSPFCIYSHSVHIKLTFYNMTCNHICTNGHLLNHKFYQFLKSISNAM